MSRVLYLDCVAGVAGDMLLSALLDAGADLQRIRAGLAGLDIEGLELRTERVTRHALSATHATVHAARGQPQRDWSSHLVYLSHQVLGKRIPCTMRL